MLTEETSIEDAIQWYDEFYQEVPLIHNSFTQAEDLARKINGVTKIYAHVVIENRCGKLCRSHFEEQSQRILIRDGFESRPNREYPTSEFFSELHATYKFEGMHGFWRFLIVGDQYRESCGAYIRSQKLSHPMKRTPRQTTASDIAPTQSSGTFFIPLGCVNQSMITTLSEFLSNLASRMSQSPSTRETDSLLSKDLVVASSLAMSMIGFPMSPLCMSLSTAKTTLSISARKAFGAPKDCASSRMSTSGRLCFRRDSVMMRSASLKSTLRSVRPSSGLSIPAVTFDTVGSLFFQA